MKNVILVAGLSTALLSPMAFAEVTLYGKAHLSVDYIDENGATKSVTDLVSHDSRFGIEGKTKINDSLAAIFKYEIGVDIDGSSTGSSFLSQRNQYVGLQGGFGKIFGGIHDTPVKELEGKIDQFGDTNADIGVVLDHYVDSQERESRFLSYNSPDMGGLMFKIAAMPGKEGTDSKGGKVVPDFGDAFSTSLTYGDLKMKKMPFFIGVGYDSEVDGKVKGEGTSILRVSGSAKMGGLALGAIAEQANDGTEEQMRYVGSAAYSIGGGALKLQYVNAEKAVSTGKGSNQWAVGWEQEIGGGASTYLMYSKYDLEGKEADLASLGLIYNF